MTFNRIRINFVWALGYNTRGIPGQFSTFQNPDFLLKNVDFYDTTSGRGFALPALADPVAAGRRRPRDGDELRFSSDIEPDAAELPPAPGDEAGEPRGPELRLVLVFSEAARGEGGVQAAAGERAMGPPERVTAERAVLLIHGIVLITCSTPKFTHRPPPGWNGCHLRAVRTDCAIAGAAHRTADHRSDGSATVASAST